MQPCHIAVSIQQHSETCPSSGILGTQWYRIIVHWISCTVIKCYIWYSQHALILIIHRLGLLLVNRVWFVLMYTQRRQLWNRECSDKFADTSELQETTTTLEGRFQCLQGRFQPPQHIIQTTGLEEDEEYGGEHSMVSVTEKSRVVTWQFRIRKNLGLQLLTECNWTMLWKRKRP